MVGKPNMFAMLRSFALVSCAAASMLVCTPGTARAEEPGIDPTGKGITGGALLGGELVMAIEAGAGVQNKWAYLAGGLGGAAAGGVGGYFVEGMDSPKPAYYLLAAGMAFIIPTTVALLQATSYKPPADYQEDRPGPGTQPAPEAAPAGPDTTTTTAPAASAAPPSVPMSLVDMHAGAWRLGVPAVVVFPTYTPTEVKKYGVEQKAEVRVPVFQATF